MFVGCYKRKVVSNGAGCNKPIETFEEILSITRELLDEVDAAQRPVRLLGLSVTNPVHTEDLGVPQQMTFDW